MVGADPDGKAGLMSPIYSWTVGRRVVIDNDCERGTTLVARLPLGKDAG
jgi:hypothetical protein